MRLYAVPVNEALSCSELFSKTGAMLLGSYCFSIVPLAASPSSSFGRPLTFNLWKFTVVLDFLRVFWASSILFRSSCNFCCFLVFSRLSFSRILSSTWLFYWSSLSGECSADWKVFKERLLMNSRAYLWVSTESVNVKRSLEFVGKILYCWV